MADFPDLKYSQAGYGYTFEPEVIRTQFASSNTRQRFMRKKIDDEFAVKLRLTAAELATFETFVLYDISGGADTFSGPYYAGDYYYTGTLEIIDGKYRVTYVQPDVFDVSYNFEVKDRDLSNEELIYDFINGYGGFDGLSQLFDALEDLVNNNNLVA